MKTRLAITLAIGLAIGFTLSLGAQSVGNFSGIFLNGNRLTASAGTAVITIPNSTGTLAKTSDLPTISSSTICTLANWCQTTTTLNDAQIKTLPTSFPSVISTPGSGKRIVILGATFSAHTTAGAYTNINGTYADFGLQYSGASYLTYGPVEDSTTTPTLNQVSALLGTTTDSLFWVNGFYVGYLANPVNYSFPQYSLNGGNYTRADAEDKAIVLKMDNNGSGNLTGGNSANTLKVTVYYVKEAF